jgi:hypothetical protein
MPLKMGWYSEQTGGYITCDRDDTAAELQST